MSRSDNSPGNHYRRAYKDPTADTAIANVMREERRRNRMKEKPGKSPGKCSGKGPERGHRTGDGRKRGGVRDA